MKKYIILLTLSSLFLTSCLEHKQFLRINRNGSAEIEINYSIPDKYETVLASMEGAIKQLEGQEKVSRRIDPTPRFFDQRQVFTYFQKFEGVTVHTHSSYVQDGQRQTLLKLQIANLRKALEADIFPGWKLKQDKEKKSYTLEIRNGYNKLKNKKLDDETKKLLKGLKLNFTIRTPRLISESNSPNKTGNTAKWNYDDSNFQKAPEAFSLTFSSKGLSFFPEEKE